MPLRASRSRGRKSAARLLLLVGMAALAGCSSARSPSTPVAGPAESTGGGSTSAPELAGVESTAATFTAEQAESGRRVFGSVCSVCHGRNEFRGPIFELTWVAEPVGHLFQHISTTMPQDRPGSLSIEEYASIVAYFLQLNGREPGGLALPADRDALSRMRW